jgi:hypothetical protein
MKLNLDQMRYESTHALALRWVGAKCWLNGMPAVIVGRLFRVALVCAIDPTEGELACPWHHINQMMLLCKGNFFGKSGVN